MVLYIRVKHCKYSYILSRADMTGINGSTSRVKRSDSRMNNRPIRRGKIWGFPVFLIGQRLSEGSLEKKKCNRRGSETLKLVYSPHAILPNPIAVSYSRVAVMDSRRMLFVSNLEVLCFLNSGGAFDLHCGITNSRCIWKNDSRLRFDPRVCLPCGFPTTHAQTHCGFRWNRRIATDWDGETP